MFVRPFDGALVRPADAGRLVVPMPESGDETSVPFEPTAYEARSPGFFRYDQLIGSRRYPGVVCTMDAIGFADGHVRGHERVLPDRVAALVTHLATRPARIELVTTLHRAGPVFAAAVTDDQGDPLVEVTTPDGVRHTVWRLPDTTADDLATELAAGPHYVADGHHRVAASLRLWEAAARPERFPVAAVSYGLDGLDLSAHPGAGGVVPDLDEVLALADAGRTVAPKTTAFRPKPASGLFVRST